MGQSNINITGGTIGAMAVGGGATARGSIGGPKPAPAPRLRVSFESHGATRETTVAWLRKLADEIEIQREHSPVAQTDADGASVAWSVDADTPAATVR